MSEFEDVYADWLQDCTSPGKTLFTGGPGLLPCLKADFVSEFNPWSFLCSEVGFCRLWLPRNTGAGVMCWCQGLTHKHPCDNRFCPVTVSLLTCVNDIIAQHDRISPKSFLIYWFTWWNTRQGCALLAGERTGKKGRAEGAAPSSAATHVGDTSFWGRAGPSCFLSPTNSVGFTTGGSCLCSLV